MSKKGGGGGGSSISGRGGNSRLGGKIAFGGSSGNVGNSHFKAVQNDAKYEMLMWQSKLQEKFLKEQKQAQSRRKSDEDQRALNPSRRQPLRGGSSGSGRSTNTHIISTREHTNAKVNLVPKSPPQGPPYHNAMSMRGERLIEISREPFNPPETETGTGTQTPTQGSEFSSYANYNGNRDRGATNAASKYLGDIQITGDQGAGESLEESPNNDGDKNVYSSNLRNHYRESGANNEVTMSLPKIVKPSNPSAAGRMSNSVSCDNLGKTSYYPAFSTNLAFFGLSGFGSGTGAGNPKRSPSGRLITSLQGHPEIRYHQKDTRGFDQTLRYMMDKERIVQYKEDLDKQIEEKEKRRGIRVGHGHGHGWNNGGSMGPIKIMSSHESNQLNFGDRDASSLGQNAGGESFANFYSRRSSRNGGIELAPLIRKYRSLPKLNTLSSTDVTRPYGVSPRRGGGDSCLSPEPEEVAKSLSLQLEEKQKASQILAENERLANEKHFSTWDSFWGRPGCGAPIFYSKGSRIGASTPSLAASRSNLFNALHMTHTKK